MDDDSTTSNTSGSFPPATQPQIIRAHQKDYFHLVNLREQVETVLRSWLGTRWITRWAPEVDVLTHLGYLGLTSVTNSQSLGEEYVDIWQYSNFTRKLPSAKLRIILALFLTLPRYLMSQLRRRVPAQSGVANALRTLPELIEVITEVNLAAFYLFGTYYDMTKRLFRIRNITTNPEDPHNPPPTYSLLGVLIAFRLLYRLYSFTKALSQPSDSPEPTPGLQYSATASGSRSQSGVYVDSKPLSDVVAASKRAEASSDFADPETDEHTMLDVREMKPQERAGRKCPLCLEERTGSSATECGHVFCWTCVAGWGREKAECPLCRQPLALSKLIPLYNL